MVGQGAGDDVWRPGHGLFDAGAGPLPAFGGRVPAAAGLGDIGGRGDAVAGRDVAAADARRLEPGDGVALPGHSGPRRGGVRRPQGGRAAVHKRVRHFTFIERTSARPADAPRSSAASPARQLRLTRVGRTRPGHPRLARLHHGPARACASCTTSAGRCSPRPPSSTRPATRPWHPSPRPPKTIHGTYLVEPSTPLRLRGRDPTEA